MAKGMWIGANGAVTLKNLLDGGKFKDTTYWTASNATYTVSGYVATVTSTGNWASLYRDVDTTNGHIYYARIRVKYATTTSHNGAMLAFKTRSNLGGSSTASVRATKFDGTWQSISVRTTLNYADARVLLYNPYTSSGTAMTDFTVQWNQPLLIDLTACFGAGKEPTKEWCDSNISFFDSTTITNNPNVSNVARRVKNWWIGIDGSGYRSLFNVPAGDKINIGGNIFTVVAHSVKNNYMGFSGTGTILWHDEPVETSPVSMNSTLLRKPRNLTSAINTTISNMAFTNTFTSYGTFTSKFAILNNTFVSRIITSAENRKRYYNGSAVEYWNAGSSTGYEYIESAWDADGNPIEDDYYIWKDTYHYYVDTSGKCQSYVYDTSSDYETSAPGIEAWPPSTIKKYYYYACEVDGNTKVTYNANTGYWELWSE